MAPLVAIAVLILLTTAREPYAERSLAQTRDVKAALNATLVGLLDAESSVRGFVLTGESEWLVPYQRARPQIQDQLARLGQLLNESGDPADRLERLRTLTAARLDALEELSAHAAPARPPKGYSSKGTIS